MLRRCLWRWVKKRRKYNKYNKFWRNLRRGNEVSAYKLQQVRVESMRKRHFASILIIIVMYLLLLNCCSVGVGGNDRIWRCNGVCNYWPVGSIHLICNSHIHFITSTDCNYIRPTTNNQQPKTHERILSNAVESCWSDLWCNVMQCDAMWCYVMQCDAVIIWSMFHYLVFPIWPASSS